jgi:hypothetical protein
MAEYKITRVSQEAPKEYQGEHGTTYYIKVMLDGHERPVSIGKKKPDALKVGDTVYGTITETQYETDRFTADKMQGGYAGGKSNYQPREDHHEAIKAQWAIGQAVQLMLPSSAKNALSPAVLEDTAKMFFAMVDRVKSSEPKSGYDTFKQAGEQIKAKQDAPVSNEEVDSLLASGEPVNLDDIPF